jgi:hypothetical protein
MVNIKNLYSPFILISHPVFLVIFFILTRYNDNQDELLFSDLTYVFSIILPTIIFIVLSLTVLLKIYKKSLTKPILTSSYAVVLFFIYVPLHNALYEFQINSIILGRHSILLPIVIIFAVITIYFFLKSKHDYKKLLSISYAIVLILIIFNISEILFYTDIYPYSVNTDLIQDFLITENPRDVYYILLDEHSGTKALETYFNYDNSDFDNSLKEMGFFIPNTSFSNYSPTRMSIPAILNMDYVDGVGKNLKLKEYEIILERMISDNVITKNFEKNNYDIIYFYNELNMQIKSNSGIELCNNSIGSQQFFSFILDNTPLVVLKNILDTGNNNEHAENRLCILESIPYLDDITSKPKFVYAHVLAPHPPFVFKSDGTIYNYYSDSKSETEAYLEQLEFIDYKVLEMVKLLLEKDPKPIIVIQSDHGYRADPIVDNFENLDRSFSNISAFYFPNVELTDDSIHTTVNTFRILFNENFGTDYELLENRIYIIDEQKGDYYQTSEVTNTLIP